MELIVEKVIAAIPKTKNDSSLLKPKDIKKKWI